MSENKPLDWRDLDTCQRCGKSSMLIMALGGQRVCGPCWRGDTPKRDETEVLRESAPPE
jgi:hypothetical protein